MKTLIVIILLGYSSFALAQDCSTLGKLTTFKGLTFGKKISPADEKYFMKSGKFYFLNKDKQDSWKYCSFQEFYFSTMSLSTLKDSSIYQISLWNNLDSFDLTQLNKREPISKYIAIGQELLKLFGDSTRTINEINDYDQFKRLLGNKFITVWECDKIRLQLVLVYDSANHDLDSIGIDIISKDLEKKAMIETLVNK